jgi:hypothetical protein
MLNNKTVASQDIFYGRAYGFLAAADAKPTSRLPEECGEILIIYLFCRKANFFGCHSLFRIAYRR